MSDQLKIVDREIDIQTIMLTRVVDACISVVRPYMVTNLDGPDPLPTDNPGFFFMVSSVYQNVVGNIVIDGDKLIKEYVAEEEKKRADERAMQMKAQEAIS